MTRCGIDAHATAADVVEADLDMICANLAELLPTLTGQRLLITGGGGFLGYYLVQSLLYWNRKQSRAQPIELVVCDLFPRGLPTWLDRLRGTPGLRILRHDIARPLPAELPVCDYILHAASIASPTYYRAHPIETMDANVGGLRHLLEHARDRQDSPGPVRGLLFFSSSEIYGDPEAQHIPTPETYRGYVSCTGPRACYDESKRYGETLCVNFARQCGLPVKIVRPFNNYGPGLRIDDRRVLSDFARDVLNKRDIVLLSDGTPTRTFCYVADAVIGYYRALILGHAGEAYNIGVEAPEITIAELAERVARLARELFGYRGRLIRCRSLERNYLTDNPQRRCPAIDKAREQLGYAPCIALDDGLTRTLRWYREHCREQG